MATTALVFFRGFAVVFCAACAVCAPTAHGRFYFALLTAINVCFIAGPWWRRRRTQRCVLTVGVRVNAFGRRFIVKSVSGQNVVLDELPEVE